MNYGSTESQSGSIDRQSSSTVTAVSYRRKIERKFLLPGIQVFGYSVGHIHNDICSALWFSYFITFMEQVLLFDSTSSGLLLLIGQIADGVATPLVGLESDRNIETCTAYGKRKTWHLIGTFLSLSTFPFIFQRCYGGEHATKNALFFYYSMLIIIFQFAWAAIQINHMSMATDLTPYSCERVKLTARRSSFTVFSNILVYLFTWLILHVNNQPGEADDTTFTPNDAPSFRLIVITLCGVGFLFSLLFHFFVKEKKHNEQARRPNDDVNSVDFSDRSNHLRWKHWFRFTIFYQVAALYMVSRLIINITQVFIPLYLVETLHSSKESVAYIPLVIYCSGFVGSIIVELMNKRLSNLQIFFFGSVVSLSSFIWVFFGTSKEYANTHIYFVSVLIGISSQTININSQSILNDMIGQNTASSAFVFGAMSLLDKFCNGLFVMIIQVMRETEPSSFLRYALSYVCGGSSVVSILILVSIIPHNFDRDLTRCRLNRSRSNISTANTVNTESTYQIARSTNLINYANVEENRLNEESGLLSSAPTLNRQSS